MNVNKKGFVTDHPSIKPKEALHRIKKLAHKNEAFAESLRGCHSTQDAADLAMSHGISIKPETLWRHRGTLLKGGLPTWPG